MIMEFYFPTPLWWEDTDLENADLEKLAYRLREEDPIGRRLSNQGGWQSKDFRPGTHPEMAALEAKVKAQAENSVRDFGYREDLCFVLMENFWININERGHTNSVHTHDNSFVSGAYYIKASEDQGNITFYKSYSQDFIIASQAVVDRYTPISASAISFKPKTGKLIMFPGWLPHGVERNETEETRISVSFNIKLIRTDDERYWPKNT